MVGSWPRALALGREDLCQCSIETTTNTPAYFTYPIDFMEYLDKLVVIFIWRHTCLPKNGRRVVQLIRRHFKTAMSRRKNYTNHHRQEVNLRVEDQVCLQATSLSREPSIFMASEAHTKIYRPFQDHFKTKSRHLSAGVTTRVTHYAQRFPHDTTPEVFPTS